MGNLTGDPVLRFVSSGAAVASFTVASTPRTVKQAANDLEVDGEALFMRCSAWRQMAENVAEAFRKGYRVIVTGRLRQRSYETREGEKRTVVELEVDDVGPSARWTGVRVLRTERGSRAPASATAARAGTDDPWATPPPDDSPPFHHNPRHDSPSF